MDPHGKIDAEVHSPPVVRMPGFASLDESLGHGVDKRAQSHAHRACVAVHDVGWDGVIETDAAYGQRTRATAHPGRILLGVISPVQITSGTDTTRCIQAAHELIEAGRRCAGLNRIMQRCEEVEHLIGYVGIALRQVGLVLRF